MKVSVNWLEEFTDIGLSNEELVKKIGSQLGEVEETIDLAKRYEGIVIARVIGCRKHPGADKLSLCKIDNGKGTVQVVCGAPNVREGQLVVWIPPGKVVPATFDKDPFTLEAREIRGELSHGMLASGHELGINDDHNGIVTLDKGKPGEGFAKTYGLDDFIIDIENKMFTHRPDCFGLLGVAREVAGIQKKKFKSPAWYTEENKNKAAKENLALVIKNELPELVPRFMAQVVENVEVKPSSLEIQIKLKKVGIKPINNIVDITNYAMYLTGQPLHAYDYDKVASKSSKSAAITIRKPKKGEKLKLLGGKIIEPHSEAVMIATDKELIGIGGVTGGADTEVDAKTKNIILECANFDLYSVRRTSMIHGLFTEAVTRFSKGQSPLQNDKVFSYAVDMIGKQSGGSPSGAIHDLHGSLPESKPMQIDNKFINARLGLNLVAEEIVEMLRNVEFKAEITRGSVLILQPPFWRTDIEIKEDIVEEVGRLYGYDNLPLELPKTTTSPSIVDEELSIKQWIRSRLSSLGANEVLTYSFVHEELLKSAGQDKGLAFKIKNALSPELQYYRLSLAPSLIEKVHSNVKAGFDSFALFEIGKVHGKSEIGKDGIPTELGRVAGVLTGDYFQAKYFARQLYPESFEITYETPNKTILATHKMASSMLAPFSEKRSAVAFVNGRPLGVVGEFKPRIYQKFKLPEKCAGFELFLSVIAKAGQNTVSDYKPMPKYPLTDQDISLRTDFKTGYTDIKSALKDSLDRNSPDDVEIDIRCIDIFAKDNKNKHTAFRISAASGKRTLTAEVMNKLLDEVEPDLKKRINAQRI
jgi:phenylalanyl-tRNA synthetase beta chain